MGENSSLRVPLRNCFLLIAESIRRKRRSQFRRCDKVSAGRMPLAGRQHQAAKFVTCANGRTASPHCPWIVVRTGMHCRFKLSVGLGVALEIKGMDRAEFQDWLSAAGRLTSAQRAKATDADEKRSVDGSGAASTFPSRISRRRFWTSSRGATRMRRSR